MYYRTPSRKDVDHAADVLEVEEPERIKMHNFYARERVQDRQANIKLLKGLVRFAGEAFVLLLLCYMIYAVWTERLPQVPH